MVLKEGYTVRFVDESATERVGFVKFVKHDLMSLSNIATVEVSFEVNFDDIKLVDPSGGEAIEPDALELLGAALYALKMKPKARVTELVITKVEEAIMWHEQLERE